MNALLEKKRVEESHLALKQAAVGSSPDIPYEQALANIAHDSLRSRSPTLLEYEIGFQLIDKSKGGEKAIGAFGFQAGDRTLLVPVIYFDGEVSGHEVVYVPDQNICVPSTEGWISYLTQKQPDTVGSQVPSNNRMGLGIRGAPLSLITRSPMKYASEQQKEALSKYPDWCHPVVNWFAKLAISKENDRINWSPSLGEYLKKSSVAEIERFMNLLHTYPAFKMAAEKMNQGMYNELEKSIDAAVDRSRLPRIFGSVLGKPDKEDPKYKVVRYTQASKALVPYDLSDSDKEKLVQNGYIVQDKRKDDEKPKVYPDPVNQENFQLQHATENCIDNVFVRPGDFERCLVLTKMLCPAHAAGASLVVRLKDKKAINAKPGEILVENDSVDQKELDSFIDKLPKVKDFSFSKDKEYVILNKRHGVEATCCFALERDYGKSGNTRVLSVISFCGNSKSSVIGADVKPVSSFRRGFASSGCKHSPLQIRIHPDSQSIRKWNDELVVPEDARVLALDLNFSLFGSDKDKLQLADLRDASAIVWKGLTKLEVRRGHSQGREFSIDQKELTSKSAALLHLFETHKLDANEADELLSAIPAGATRVFGVKKADDRPSWMRDEGSYSTPDIPWDTNTGSNDMANPNTDNDTTINYNLPVDGMMASQNDPSNWDPKAEPNVPYMQQAMQAAQKGQRDVFNVKAILTIANKDQSGDLGPIITCMDALGRRYIAFRWQREDMNEQYGTADASEIEDGLLNNFETLGEMIIAMYERDLRNGDRSELLRSKLTIHSQDTGDDE